MRIDRVYTKGGDKGETSLIGGERVSKADPRLDCYGTVDEVNATLGLVRIALESSAAGSHLLPIIHRVQNELFNLGAELAAPDPERRAKLPRIEARHVDGLERDIDAVNDDLAPLTSFVLPGRCCVRGVPSRAHGVSPLRAPRGRTRSGGGHRR